MNKVKAAVVATVVVVTTALCGVVQAEAGGKATVKHFNDSERTCVSLNLSKAAVHIGDSVTGGEHTVNASKDREWVASQLRALADNVQYNDKGRASLDRCW